MAATDSRLSLVTTSVSAATRSSIMVNLLSSGVLRPCLRGERIHAEIALGQACSRSSPAGRSWGAPHRGVPELLDGRVDQLVIAGQLCLDGPGPLVGEHLDLAGLDGVEDLLGD